MNSNINNTCSSLDKEAENIQRVMNSNYAKTTIVNYQRAVKRFREWGQNQHPVLDVDHIQKGLDNRICGYILSKCDEESGQGKSQSTAEQIMSALLWYYTYEHPLKLNTGIVH
jgi:site-specific recombinase XerD